MPMPTDERMALTIAVKVSVAFVAIFAVSAIFAVLSVFYGGVITRLANSISLMINSTLIHNVAAKIIVVVLYCGGMLFSLKTPIYYLREKHASEVNMMFYFLSLSFALSSVATVAAIKFGAIDSAGNYSGDFGQIYKYALTFFMSVNDTAYVSLGIICLTIAPQLITYIFSGVF